MLQKAILPSMRRWSCQSSRRLFHPLAGQSLNSIHERWQTPPSANLVPIVIEQTVSSLHSPYWGICLFILFLKSGKRRAFVWHILSSPQRTRHNASRNSAFLRPSSFFFTFMLEYHRYETLTRLWLSLNCYSWKLKTQQNQFICISIPPVEVWRQVSRYTIQ